MSIKGMIKSRLDTKRWNYIVSHCKYIRDFPYRSKKRIMFKSLNMIDSYEIFFTKGMHTFFGYYDIQQLNKSENKLLVHKVAKRAVTSKDKAEIGYYDLNSKDYIKLAETCAWCWQQGSRLRWHPINENQVIFNNMVNSEYVTQIWDIEKRQCIRQINSALYDIDCNFQYGLGLNFSRLQRLRPGYGYDTLEDITKGENVPEDDGIYYVDLNNGDKRLIISLLDLAVDSGLSDNHDHYINHISISPDGNHFMFFHVAQPIRGGDWITRLFVVENDGSHLKLLEGIDKVSHYCWKNNYEILVTCYRSTKQQYYALYNINTGEKQIIDEDNLKFDGHPSYTVDGLQFISDTYPRQHNVQELFIYNTKLNRTSTIAKLYSDSRLFGEKRCDLHPRLSLSQKIVTTDSTFLNGVRQVIMIKAKGAIKCEGIFDGTK